MPTPFSCVIFKFQPHLCGRIWQFSMTLQRVVPFWWVMRYWRLLFLWDVFSVSFWLSHQELCQKPLRWIHHCRLHWTFGLLVKLKDFLHVFLIFFTHLWSLFERRALMGRSASQNLQAMAHLELIQCTVAIATPPLCPDHRSTSTDQVRGRQKIWDFFFFSELCPVSPTPVPFDLLSVDHEQDWCSLLLYPLKTKTPVPLPLSVTLSSLTNKVRAATVPQPFVLYFFLPHFFVNKLCTLNVLMVALLSSLNGLNIQYNWLLKYLRHYSF